MISKVCLTFIVGFIVIHLFHFLRTHDFAPSCISGKFKAANRHVKTLTLCTIAFLLSCFFQTLLDRASLLSALSLFCCHRFAIVSLVSCMKFFITNVLYQLLVFLWVNHLRAQGISTYTQRKSRINLTVFISHIGWLWSG